MKNNKKLKTRAIIAGILLGPAIAIAATLNSNLQVSAIITSACSVSANMVNFGIISPQAFGNASSASTIVAQCSSLTPYTISMGPSPQTGLIMNRAMRGVTGGNVDLLQYNIYADLAATQVFGDGTSGVTHSGIGTGANQIINIYGRVPLNQFITADSYTDTLPVLMSY